MGTSLGYILSIADTQVGRVAFQEHVVDGFDIDDVMSCNSISQGVHLQFALAGEDVDPSKVKGAIPTVFGG